MKRMLVVIVAVLSIFAFTACASRETPELGENAVIYPHIDKSLFPETWANVDMSTMENAENYVAMFQDSEQDSASVIISQITPGGKRSDKLELEDKIRLYDSSMQSSLHSYTRSDTEFYEIDGYTAVKFTIEGQVGEASEPFIMENILVSTPEWVYSLQLQDMESTFPEHRELYNQLMDSFSVVWEK